MSITDILAGTVHDIVPEDLESALVAHPKALDMWNALTVLARNEWICWITIVKKEETRKEHIERLCEQLVEGKRRPCCWPGCPHRRESAKKWFR